MSNKYNRYSSNCSNILCFLFVQALVSLIFFIIVFYTIVPNQQNVLQLNNYSLTRPTKEFYTSGFTVANEKLCLDNGRNLKLFIMVNSHPNHTSHRIAIRKTWGSVVKYSLNLSLGFLIGLVNNKTLDKIIQSESDIYGDIIRTKNIDTYNNLTLKTLSILEWITNYCPNATFLLKCDDDMFINMDNLLSYISRLDPLQRVIRGKLIKNRESFVNRNPRNTKWFMSKKEYFFEYYPSFLSGPAYLLPVTLSPELYDEALKQPHLRLEDVYITGIVATKLNIAREQIRHLQTLRLRFSYCRIRDFIGLNIHMSEIYGFWYVILNKSFTCKIRRKRNGTNRKKKVHFKGRSLVRNSFKSYFEVHL